MMRRVARAGLALAATLSVTACDVPNFGMPRGATKQAQDILGLWHGLVVTALAVGAVVWALIFFSIFRFRRRRNDDGEAPSQQQYSIGLEVAYTLVPLIIVAVLFYFTFATQEEVTKVSADPAVHVDVTAYQWGWRFHYDGTDVTIATQGDNRPVLTLPANEVTRITLTATDVIHSFFVPDFLYKRDATPGLVQTFDYTPVRTGTFLGRCAEFCGLRHAQMLFEVRVVDPPAFQQWLSQQQASPASPA